MKYIIKKKLYFWEYLVRCIDWVERIIENAQETNLNNKETSELINNTKKRKKQVVRNFIYYTLRNVRKTNSIQ